MEKYIWSLDVSTTNVGCSLFDMNGKLIELKHLSLKNDKDILVEDRDLYKADIFKEYVQSYKERVKNELNGEIVHTIIEAPLQNTPKNINTTALLLGFNGMARYILYEIFGIMPIKVTVYEARKLFLKELVKISYKKGEKVETLSFPEKYKNDKKLYVWEKVAKLEPNIQWFYGTKNNLKELNFDLADSYACGYAGMIKLGIIKE